MDKHKAKPPRKEIGQRTLINAPISLVVERPDGKRVARGTATLKNLSLRGALITDLKLMNDVTLNERDQYCLRFSLMVGPFTGLEALCEPVRYESANAGFGVRLPKGFKFAIT
ncbi:MAG: hypothetical protein L6Q71_11810 [Planctomycetes bacterium]|nr:hypothetical protein [Planctomycetota bacterium]NUQ35469.1 hypothetical protein [Planctomycetaceae bacterium]